jgi:putative membrane protein insertion efficiency factor
MLARFLVAIVMLYQRLLSPLLRLTLGSVCRFEPSCSRYAVGCLEQHGALRGGLLSIVRVCKCHPFHPGGHDPVPPRRTARSEVLPPEGARAPSANAGADPRRQEFVA